MRIFLTGATGFIGQHLLLALLRQQHQVTACCRQPQMLQQRFPAIHIAAVDFNTMLDSDEWLPYLKDIDVVINVVGIIQDSSNQSFVNIHANAPKALFEACERADVKRVIQISALGADVDQSARYYQSKGMADQSLQASALDWVIFKPSVVYGPNAKSMAFFKAMACLPVVPLIGEGQQLLQPVYIDDLVNAIVKGIDTTIPGKQVIPAVGPKSICFIDLLTSLRHWFGKSKMPVIKIPAKLFRQLAITGRWIGEPVINPESVDMLEQGNCADVDEFTEFLGYEPQSLDKVLQSAIPTQAEHWHAHLYLMRPILRITIALVWIWAGWVSAWVYPYAESFQMLTQVGIPAFLQSTVLYSASALDFCLGLVMLAGWRLRLIVYLQVLVMFVYSIVISIALPEFWAHPFGPMIKNLPLLMASFILLILEEHKP